MGICGSVASSVHVLEYGLEDNVVYDNGYRSNQPIKVGSIYSHEGQKGLNQDAAILCQGYGIKDGDFFGVFDGHGKNGHIVSKMVRNRLPSLLLNQRLALGKISEEVDGERFSSTKNFVKWKEACRGAFMAMDKEIQHLEKLDFSCSGTAAIVAVRQGNDLLIANLGDSRAVLGTKIEDGVKAVQLTNDQKPNVPSEAERITKCRGRVLALQEEPHIQRVWLPFENSPGLAMSRALGDFLLKNHGVIALPDVSYHHLCPEDQFLVLATDGVWDVLSNDEVVSIVCSTNGEEEAAKAIVDAAIAAWEEKFPNSKRDDCTAICLFLQKNLQISIPGNA